MPLSRCTVRSWLPEDVPSLVEHANNVRIWRNLRDRFPHPYSYTDGATWVKLARSAEPQTCFAIEVDGHAVGGVSVELKPDVYRQSAEVGYWLGEAYWGRGIATEAVRALCDWALDAFDLCRLYATLFEYNAASARVLEKAGFLLEARHRKAVVKEGRLWDELVYARVVD